MVRENRSVDTRIAGIHIKLLVEQLNTKRDKYMQAMDKLTAYGTIQNEEGESSEASLVDLEKDRLSSSADSTSTVGASTTSRVFQRQERRNRCPQLRFIQHINKQDYVSPTDYQ